MGRWSTFPNRRAYVTSSFFKQTHIPREAYRRVLSQFSLRAGEMAQVG